MGYTVYIILIPMLMFLFLGLGSKWLAPRVAGLFGTLGMGVSAALAYLTAWNYFAAGVAADGAYPTVTAWSVEWLRFHRPSPHRHGGPARSHLGHDAGGHHHRLADGAYLQLRLHEG